MVENKGQRPEPEYVPLLPETAGWGEWAEVFRGTARMRMPVIPGGKAVYKTVEVRVVRNPETAELVAIPGGEGQPIRWHDLRGVLSPEELERIEGALRGEAGRRKKSYQP